MIYRNTSDKVFQTRIQIMLYFLVIDNVLSKPQTLDDANLSVERFNPILGSLADMQWTEQKTANPTSGRVPPKAKPRQRKTTELTEVVDLDLYRYLEKGHPAQLNLALKDPQPKIEMTSDSVCLTFSSQDAKKHFSTSINDHYKCAMVPVSLDLLNHGLREEMKGTLPVFSSATSVVFLEKYNEGFIKLVGRASPVFDRANEEVKKCIAKVEERLSQRDDVIQILPVQVTLLHKSTVFQR